MFEDVMTDYVRRTVTIERHPHKAMGESNLGDVCISIHPCQHGNVMKNIVGNIVGEGGNGGNNVNGEKGEIGVDSYMFIFLKFVSSIIPTVNYDFTMQVRTK